MQETLRVGKISHYITINSDQSNSAEPLTAAANGRLCTGRGGALRLPRVWLADGWWREAPCSAHRDVANQRAGVRGCCSGEATGDHHLCLMVTVAAAVSVSLGYFEEHNSPPHLRDPAFRSTTGSLLKRYNLEFKEERKMQPFRGSPGVVDGMALLGGHHAPVSPPCSPPAPSVTPPSPTPNTPPSPTPASFTHDNNGNVKKEPRAGKVEVTGRCDSVDESQA